MKKRFFLILFFILLTGYMIFFPEQLTKEILFLPSWVSSIESSEAVYSEEAFPFMLDSRIGYFSGNGRILYSENIFYGAAVSDDIFLNYSSVSDKLVIQDVAGRIVGSIETEGLPFFIDDRFFVISPDRLIVKEYSSEGDLLLTLSPGSMITSMDAGEGVIVLGLLNGSISVYDSKPEPVFTYYSTDSRYTVAYACAVTGDGNRVAAVTGLYPQQLVCFELRNEAYIPVFRMNMKDEYRRNLLLDYSDDGKLLYVENPDGIDLYSTATFLRKDVRIAGTVRKAVFPGVKKISYLVSEGEEQGLLKVYRSDIGRIADFPFPPGELYFYPCDKCFFAGSGNIIVRYDLIEG